MTWEGAEENYNVFRWYRAGWGRYSQSDPLLPLPRTRDLSLFLSEDASARHGVGNPYAYAMSNPAGLTDPSGLTPIKNNGPKPIPYKPEECSTTPCPIKLCMPGETCDVDGIYPSDCKTNPVKIVN
jgi:hypothetical protein